MNTSAFKIHRKQAFTTTLPVNMVAELEKTAKEMGVQKNDVLQIAFSELQKKIIQEKIRLSYREAKNDPEYQAFAEMGFDDWAKNIDL